MSAKRYTGGVTDIPGSDPMGNIAMLDPRKYSVYHQDFSHFPAILPTTNATGYNSAGYTISASADTVISLSTDADVTNVALTFTAGATDTQYARVQLINGGFVLESGKKAFLETRLELTAATLDTHFWAVGLLEPEAAGDTSKIADDTTFVLLADDSFAFYKDGNQSSIYGRCGENDVNTNTAMFTTQVTATWYRLSAYYDGSEIYWYVNNALVGVATPAAIPITPVAPTVIMITQKAEAVVLKVDYLTVVLEQ